VAVAGALETAHRAGVVHGDVTPASVRQSRFGIPVLDGLGIAAPPAAGNATGPGPYAAPEVVVGGPLGAATDVYGLAATIYDAVAGHPPFDHSGAESPAGLTLRILRDPVRPLDPARAPAQLCDLLASALAKEPAQRPATAAEFAAELAAVEQASGWPVSPLIVGPIIAPQRRPAPGRRPRPEWVSGAGAAPSSGAPWRGPARPPSTTPG
jgi:serine/threonine protein kinase